MNPNYICANGHTFDEPLIGEKLDHSPFHRVLACPVCYTRDFKRYQFIPLDEPKDLEPKSKTRVTKPGRPIAGSTMIPFKCGVCSCEFESPVSECSLFIVEYVHATPAVIHKCPAPFCGAECEVILDNKNIFTE